MTELGLYSTKKSVNKAEIARRTGISKARITQLSNNSNTKLTAIELYKIALSLGKTEAQARINELEKEVS